MSHETPWDSFQPSQGTELLTQSPPIPSKCWSSCFQLFLSVFPFLLPHPLKLFDLKSQEHPTHFSSHLPSLLPLPSTLPACCLQLHKSADNIFPLSHCWATHCGLTGSDLTQLSQLLYSQLLLVFLQNVTELHKDGCHNCSTPVDIVSPEFMSWWIQCSFFIVEVDNNHTYHLVFISLLFLS